MPTAANFTRRRRISLCNPPQGAVAPRGTAKRWMRCSTAKETAGGASPSRFAVLRSTMQQLNINSSRPMFDCFNSKTAEQKKSINCYSIVGADSISARCNVFCSASVPAGSFHRFAVPLPPGGRQGTGCRRRGLFICQGSVAMPRNRHGGSPIFLFIDSKNKEKVAILAKKARKHMGFSCDSPVWEERDTQISRGRQRKRVISGA